ncbi:MAG TPA: ABC transporter ATP-binding protein, partial [Clostridiaceae bacterium]|nr:ABC transporter ATP-binding protein [Clostridiaceae bacterium]
IQQIASPQVLYDEPVNVFVAGFIGSPQMNMANAVVVKQGDKIYLQFGEYMLELPPEKANALEKQGYVGSEVIFGIRPEDVHEDEAFVNNENATLMKAYVEVTERLGSETLLYLVINDINFTARVSPKTKTQSGDTIMVAFDMPHMHIFDKETEKAIVH